MKVLYIIHAYKNDLIYVLSAEKTAALPASCFLLAAVSDQA